MEKEELEERFDYVFEILVEEQLIIFHVFKVVIRLSGSEQSTQVGLGLLRCLQQNNESTFRSQFNIGMHFRTTSAFGATGRC